MTPTVSEPIAEPVPVITAFLWDGQAVLLAQRSEAVSTYPGHWAGISGYLEGEDPAEWALVEIAEECGMERSDVTLRAVGEPLVAGAVVAGLPTEPPVRGRETRAQPGAGDAPRTFLVHPFLFSIADRSLVRPDWEAQQFEWVAVDQMLRRTKRPAVPRLYEAFERVWPPWPVERAIEANRQLANRWLRADRSLGAGTLARSAAREIAKLVRLAAEATGSHAPRGNVRQTTTEPSPPGRGQVEGALSPTIFPQPNSLQEGEDYVPTQSVGTSEMQLVFDAVDELRVVRPSMVPPINLLGDLGNAIRAATSADDALTAIDALVRRSEDAEQAVVENAAAHFRAGERIMTISYSSTVRRALEAAARKIGRVVVCESRPLYEGQRLAKELHAAGLAVTVITEAQMLSQIENVDRVLLGADAVLADGSVVNKAGSALVAMAARQAGKPVTVVAESLKWVRDPADYQFTPEANTADEVWPNAPSGIEVVNEYFERIPAEWIDEVVSE